MGVLEQLSARNLGPDGRRLAQEDRESAAEYVLATDPVTGRDRGAQWLHKVHNFTVDGLHTYYVASSRESAPVLAHNEDDKPNGNPCGPTVFMLPEDKVQKSIPRQKSVEGFEDYDDVWVHGSPRGVAPDYDAAEGGTDLIDHRVLARMIQNSPNYPGGPVRLCSCNTGSVSGSFAQDLANKLGQNVLAPEGYLYVWEDGGHNMGRDGAPVRKSGDSGGRWRGFRPGGGR
ncbi:hypothetical protein C8D87_10641 [Lentzea atacamensis]|uniref:Uncharacterized protein n=1 Tax=Lentzea atacamensis TaxID=531938 RepID=A0ABX9E410_9PSEU|nr:hypothetical protein [Lentzea atacamensis]RAS63640.1 hypothetical protein C8D87_10641 [Lentzea atacamensis]